VGGGRLLGFAQVDGAVAGADYYGLAATVHAAGDAGRAEGAFDGDGNAEADVTIMGAGVDVGLEITGKINVNAAIAGVKIPR